MNLPANKVVNVHFVVTGKVHKFRAELLPVFHRAPSTFNTFNTLINGGGLNSLYKLIHKLKPSKIS